ncbi:MAG: zinc-ribbon domain containing protein [Anaerolineae bacterium]
MITFLDVVLVCRECGQEFVFTAGEQEFYAVQGLENEPRHCPACRARRKQQRSGEEPRPMTQIVCATCGKVDEVPFKPVEGRPVYCEACFRRIRGGN